MNKVYINDLTCVKNLCRVCLTESKMMLPLENNVEPKLERNVSTLWHVLYRVTCDEITCNSRYPSYICGMCLGLLNISYKFKLQYEESQKLLSEYFGDCPIEAPDLKSVIELIHEDLTDQATVELISNKGKYDLNDVLIIENVNEDKPDYTGFLRNLGNEVTATFVNSHVKIEPIHNFNKNDSVTLIDLNIGKTSIKNEDISIDNKIVETPITEDPNDDMDESDKQINRNISRCAVCQKVFGNKKYLQRHVERMHLHKRQTFVCEICGMFLKSRSSHYHHMVKHYGKRHKCSICQKMYFSASNLQQHVTAVHKNERPHLCTICGKSFSYANALDYHMRIHTGERKYKCTYCDKTFTMQCGLSRHIRVHTGQRPYKCKFCEKAFRSKGEVDCHEMTHTGYRPYHCKYCNKGFTKTFNLKMHLLGHPGSNACEVCNKTFIETQYLKIHMKRAHGYSDEMQESDKES